MHKRTPAVPYRIAAVHEAAHPVLALKHTPQLPVLQNVLSNVIT